MADDPPDPAYPAAQLLDVERGYELIAYRTSAWHPHRS
jgi:hypothetical protein